MTDAPWKNAESTDLDDDAVARITENVVRRGPALARHGRRVQRAKRAGAVVGVCGAVALAWWVERPTPKVDAPIAPLACAAWAPARDQDLGPRGVIAVEGEVALKEATPCRTVFELRSGRVTIHARDLGGGTLAVVSGDEEVVVRGTLFCVERRDESTIVSTEEGVVEVVGRARVPAGVRARITRDDTRTEPLAAQEAERMRVAVGQTVAEAQVDDGDDESAAAPSDPEPRRRRPRARRAVRAETPSPDEAPLSATELVRRAHRARKSGDIEEARRAFREAGASAGPAAEAAWIGLARMELAGKRPARALEALEERATRFPGGALELEATWLQARASKDGGDRVEAERLARRIVERWPNAPQADLARRLLSE